MIYSNQEITAKAWLVKEAVNMTLHSSGLSVDRIFLVGSYASGKATDRSDIDYLVQLKGGKRPFTLPTWQQMEEVKNNINNKRIHCVYGTLDAQQSLWHKDPVKYTFREVKFGEEIQNVDTHSSVFQG